VKNVHYYISLASYRSQDGSIDPGEPIVKEGRGKIQSPADDANIRSQATLALGCTTDQDPKLRSLIVERISANLDDRDRLVREAASRALGRLKAVRCVPKLISVWRNDFIHPVRVAAREVLLKLADEFAEARDAMDLTEKLQEEMNGY
jgi:HEAT repeat protein